MAERAYQQPEPAQIIHLYPEPPTPISSHPRYQFQEPVKWEVPEDFEGIMAFNPRHYIQAYLDLRTIKSSISPAEYQVRLEQQNRLTLHDLEKTILERLVASKSTIHYHINENGKLVSEDFAEPALERYERGQKWLEENGSNEVEREKAEVTGMYKVEALLATGKDMTIVVAPARSEGCKHLSGQEEPKDEPEDILYHMQYINVFEQKNGVITMTQLHSTHSTEVLLETLQEVDPQYPQAEAGTSLATHMLLNPAIPTKTFEQIKDKFAIDTKNTAPEELCTETIVVCTPIFLSLIQTLTDNTFDFNQIRKAVHTIYNLTDETEEKFKKRKVAEAKRIAQGLIKIGPFKESTYARTDLAPPIAAMSARQLIEKHGYQQPQEKKVPCPGGQKSFKITGILRGITRALSARSVADFAKMSDDDEDNDTSDFACGGTKENGETCTYIVKYGSGTTECPECHRKAVCP